LRIVGSVLVRNEDVFVEQAIQNVASFCDRIHAVDHVSTDATWEILQALAGELDHLEVRRARHSRVSHEVLEPYVGTDTWVVRVDGDELYDPDGLVALREQLSAGEFDSVFRVLGNVLHASELDLDERTASGYLSPPSRPISALYNFKAVQSWTDALQRLHAGRIAFADGFGWDVVEPLYEQFGWEKSPLRCLHVCFVPRSSSDTSESPRSNLGELDAYRRGALGTVERAVRRSLRRPAGSGAQVAMRADGVSWKSQKYRRGERVTVDATPFLGPP
jgi:glycosyl transferase family 2